MQPDITTSNLAPDSSGMQTSSLGKLAAALSKAQGKIKSAKKDSDNPFFKKKYADLASIWDACREQLSANGLAVIQTTETSVTDGVTVITTLVHDSGEWIRGALHMKPKDATPQGVGSAITYARRYALAAIVGIAPEDDDGNTASGKGNFAKETNGHESIVDNFTKRIAKCDMNSLVDLFNQLDEARSTGDITVAQFDLVKDRMTERKNVLSKLTAKA